MLTLLHMQARKQKGDHLCSMQYPYTYFDAWTEILLNFTQMMI